MVLSGSRLDLEVMLINLGVSNLTYVLLFQSELDTELVRCRTCVEPHLQLLTMFTSFVSFLSVELHFATAALGEKPFKGLFWWRK